VDRDLWQRAGDGHAIVGDRRLQRVERSDVAQRHERDDRRTARIRQLPLAGAGECAGPVESRVGDAERGGEHAEWRHRVCPADACANDPGLLAPATFQINRRQYVVALHLDGTYVLPPGVIAGEPIFLYGLGLGTVTPNMPAGQIVVAPNVSDNDALPFSFTLGGTAGTQTAVKRVLAGWAPGVEGGEQSAAEWTARIRVARDPPRVNAIRK
jgi:hypothetical protein